MEVDPADPGEQVPTGRPEVLLDAVLRLPQPAYGPVEVVQQPALAAQHRHVAQPQHRLTVRSRLEHPVQQAGEDHLLSVEGEAASCREPLQHPVHLQFLPQPPEDQRRPDRPAPQRFQLPLGVGLLDLLAKATSERSSVSMSPWACGRSKRPRVAITRCRVARQIMSLEA